MAESDTKLDPPTDGNVDTDDSGHGSPPKTREPELPHPSTSITELYRGKCILVTGATGFLGKVLVEKLLRSCPDIKEILILIRPSKKGSSAKRLDEFRQHDVFNRVRDERPGALMKLKPISGDVTIDNLGLAGSLLRKIITDVNFVFHCAANVRFDDLARSTLSINLVGVQNVLNVCKKCEQLQALVHVSTAYSFCNYESISEEIYPELVSPEDIIKATKWMTEDQLHATAKHYLQGRPSLYHFSKALAETLLVESDHDVPAIIVRPSIVTASMAEPFAGWIDNYNGPSGFIALCGKGVVGTLLVDDTVNADWVPVDIVANTLIAAAQYIAVKSKSVNTVKLASKGKVPIVNCTCPEPNAITWRKIVRICVPFLWKYPSAQVYGKPGGTITLCPLRYNMCRFFYHYLPAIFLDGIRCMTFRSPRMIGMFNKIHRVMSYLEYYTTRSFSFPSRNMRKLVDRMEPADREEFPIDQNVLNWTKYMENYVLGVRRYHLQETDDTLPYARKRMIRCHYAWMMMKISWVALMIRFIGSLPEGRLKKCAVFTSFSMIALTAMITRKNAC